MVRSERRREGRRIRVSRRRWRRAVESIVALGRSGVSARKAFDYLAAGEPSPTKHEIRSPEHG